MLYQTPCLVAGVHCLAKFWVRIHAKPFQNLSIRQFLADHCICRAPCLLTGLFPLLPFSFDHCSYWGPFGSLSFFQPVCFPPYLTAYFALAVLRGWGQGFQVSSIQLFFRRFGHFCDGVGLFHVPGRRMQA